MVLQLTSSSQLWSFKITLSWSFSSPLSLSPSAGPLSSPPPLSCSPSPSPQKDCPLLGARAVAEGEGGPEGEVSDADCARAASPSACRWHGGGATWPAAWQRDPRRCRDRIGPPAHLLLSVVVLQLTLSWSVSSPLPLSLSLSLSWSFQLTSISQFSPSFPPKRLPTPGIEGSGRGRGRARGRGDRR